MRPHRRAAAALLVPLAFAACTAAPQPSPSPSTEASPSVTSASPSPSPTPSPSPSPSPTSTLTPIPVQGTLRERIIAHTAAFQAIADANGGDRQTGGPGLAASVDYAERVLSGAGLAVTRQVGNGSNPFPQPQITMVQGPGDIDLSRIWKQNGSPSTPSEGLTARVVSVRADGCVAGDYAAAKGLIALVEEGACPLVEQSRAAKEAGVAVLVPFSDEETNSLEAPMEDLPQGGLAPTGGLRREPGLALRAAAEEGEVIVRISLLAGPQQITFTNLIAEAPGAADGHVVLLGAHLDSVPVSPGINDNASGVAVVLAVAQELGAAGELGGVRVVLFDAEEAGMVGSGYYVGSLYPEDQARITGYLNLDMVASPNGVLGITKGEGPMHDALVAAMGDRQHRVTDFSDLLAGTDDAPFREAGISVAGFYTGGNEPLTRDDASIFGGTAGTPRDHCNHLQCDTFEWVDHPAVWERATTIAEVTLATLRATRKG